VVAGSGEIIAPGEMSDPDRKFARDFEG
jgi:hypothetical protein